MDCTGVRGVACAQFSSAQLGCKRYKLSVWLLSEPGSSTQEVRTDGYYVTGYGGSRGEKDERAKGETETEARKEHREGGKKLLEMKEGNGDRGRKGNKR